jgi:hypothetical protein
MGRLVLLFMFWTQPILASEYLEVSVRVNEENASCGTIIKSEKSNLWIISTGHMATRNEPVVEVFYANGKKLKTPLKGKGKIVLRVENNLGHGIDFSLIQLNLGDYDHTMFKSVPLGIALKDQKCISVGCDLAIPPTEFTAKVLEIRSDRGDIFTLAEKPTYGGRSGGGLFHDGKLIAVSWGATTGKREKGIFTSAQSIKRVLKACGYERLLEEQR